MPLFHRSRRSSRRSPFSGLLFAAAVAWGATALVPRTGFAAEIQLTGSGSFKPLPAAQLAALPADLVVSRSDLASGRWSFSVRYDDAVPDADPDPQVGRYAGAIRAFRLVLGSTTIELPPEQAELIISDGGGGFPHRESIRLQGQVMTPAGLLRLGWMQVHQQPRGTELRGSAGLLASDGLPPPALLANLPTASPFDRFLELRLERPGVASLPLLYLSSSQLSVTAGPATP